MKNLDVTYRFTGTREEIAEALSELYADYTGAKLEKKKLTKAEKDALAATGLGGVVRELTQDTAAYADNANAHKPNTNDVNFLITKASTIAGKSAQHTAWVGETMRYMGFDEISKIPADRYAQFNEFLDKIPA